jgi:acetaldehyde dehydrogenase
MKVAIIGTGNIGTDLLYKILKIDGYKLVAFVGRRESTKKLPENVPYYSNGIQFFIDNPNSCDIVFDCTDACSATKNAEVFLEQNITVIDMTPSKVGRMCVPNVNCECLRHAKNVNMVTCGGQVSIPLLKYFTSKCSVSYAEVVTQISSESAGMATRINIDKYIQTTESAIQNLTNINNCKVILNVNPSPETVMQTTIFLKATKATFEDYDDYIDILRKYVKGYTPEIKPTYISDDTLMVSVKVIGSEDYLSKYAGNLDVINCAAIEVANKICSLKNENVHVPNIYDNVLDI